MTTEGRAGVTLADIIKELAQRDASALDASILGYAAAQAHYIEARGEKPEDYILYIETERGMEPNTMKYTMKYTINMERKHDI